MKGCLVRQQSPTYIAGCMHKCGMGRVTSCSVMTYHEYRILSKQASKHLHTDLALCDTLACIHNVCTNGMPAAAVRRCWQLYTGDNPVASQ